MRDRLIPRLEGLAALVIAMGLCGAAATAPLLAKKGYAHKPPVQKPASPVRYIHCAMEFGEGPCGLDPAMHRLRGQPPDMMRRDPPFDQPSFSPGR